MDYSAGMRVGPWSDLDRPRGSSGAEPDNRIPVVVLPLAFAVVFWSSPALAQDPSAWGGLFRSRADGATRSEEHTSELQSLRHLVCRLLRDNKNCSPMSSSWKTG